MYFPFFVDIKNKKCLVIGGGNVALRKVKSLLSYGVIIKVISLEFIKEFDKLRNSIYMEKRKFNENDLEGIFFVISATNDSTTNNEIYKLCSKRNILVNTVDSKESCGFIFPSLIQNGSISIGITTSGKSPLISQYLKNQFLKQIPDYFDDFITKLEVYKEKIKKSVNSQIKRKLILKQIMDIGIKNNGNIKDSDVEQIIYENLKDMKK